MYEAWFPASSDRLPLLQSLVIHRATNPEGQSQASWSFQPHQVGVPLQTESLAWCIRCVFNIAYVMASGVCSWELETAATVTAAERQRWIGSRCRPGGSHLPLKTVLHIAEISGEDFSFTLQNLVGHTARQQIACWLRGNTAASIRSRRTVITYIVVSTSWASLSYGQEANSISEFIWLSVLLLPLGVIVAAAVLLPTWQAILLYSVGFSQAVLDYFCTWRKSQQHDSTYWASLLAKGMF